MRRAKRFRPIEGCPPYAGVDSGLEWFTPPHNFRRGHKLPTDSGPSPAPRVSAGLRFAVRSLSGAVDREISKVRRLCWYLIHRGAVSLPRKDSEELGVRSEELKRPKMEASLHIIERLYCLLHFKYRSICYPVSGLRSLFQLLTPPAFFTLSFRHNFQKTP